MACYRVNSPFHWYYVSFFSQEVGISALNVNYSFSNVLLARNNHESRDSTVYTFSGFKSRCSPNYVLGFSAA